MSDNLTNGYIYVAHSHLQNAADDMVSQTKAIATTPATGGAIRTTAAKARTARKHRGMDRPLFSSANSLSARRHLGMAPHDVARDMTVLGAPVDPGLVGAWENGAYRPTENELFVLADVLWCRTTELMGIEEPRTLAEHRLARQFTVPRLTQTIKMDTTEYLKAEAENQWTGNLRQTLSLLHALNISLRQLEAATGPCDTMYWRY
jgi:hypothetical protein